MKPLKSIFALFTILVATAVSGSALAHHRDWHHRGAHHAPPSSYYVAPRSGADVQFGFSVGAPVYVYEPAPTYYYYEAPPRYYYYESPRAYYYQPGWSFSGSYSD